MLPCAAGLDNKVVAARLHVNQATVSKWRQRFIERRSDGLADDPRLGVVRTITDDMVEAVIVKTLEELHGDATHWSTRSMAKQMGMNQSAISRTWRTFGLKPHLADTRKLPNDPQFVDRVRDVVGLCLNPPEAALVLCVDEKTQVQALNRTAHTFPVRPGVPQRQSHDYARHGTTNLYAALGIASGQVIADMTARHRADEFRRFLNLINCSIPMTSTSM